LNSLFGHGPMKLNWEAAVVLPHDAEFWRLGCTLVLGL
jgi:hypothetical protein